MDIYQKLSIVTCVTSTMTLLIAAMALLPHIKSSVVIVRDAFLWVAFVLIVFGLGWYGWTSRVSSVDLPVESTNETIGTSFQQQLLSSQQAGTESFER